MSDAIDEAREEAGRPAALSRAARGLLGAAAAAYVVIGLPLFLAPEWASEHFAWTVSPFVAMTAGGWCLGTAAFAGYATARPRWTSARPTVVYVLAFGASQLGVALYERERLRAGEVLTWPYLVALGLSVVAGALALAQGHRHLRADRRPGRDLPSNMRRLRVAFVALVFFLALVAFVAPTRATNGAIFPEPLSLFSLRAFGVFYLSLGVGMLAVVGDRHADGYLVYMRAGLILVVPILVATAVYAGSFDLGEHPLQVVYPLAYVVALVGAAGALRWERRGTPVSGRT
ncbi:MAG: hypothetical protein ACLGI2_01905 [Acidimicrobiia bacterium]